MSADTSGRARPEPIKAVPVRHPGRWVGVAVIAVLVAMFVHMLVTNSAFQWSFMVDEMFRPPIIEGLRGTILLLITSMVIGIGLGIVIAIMRLSPNPVLRGVAWVYTWFFRAVPRLVLAILFGNLGILWSRLEFGLPFDRQIGALFGLHDFEARLFGFSAVDILTGFVAGMLALGLSEAAYMAEIVRAGIQSVDEGQTEAAQALGMSRAQILRRIVLPQAMRVIIPPTGNETIAMLKDTSLVAFVPVSMELFFQLKAVGSRTFQPFPMYVAATLWYLLLTSVLLVGQYYLERHYSKGFGRSGRARQRLRNLTAESGSTTSGTAQ
ncbi:MULTISPECIES: amino acid ABC transporter permease [Micromonospora]|uniref:Amino acid ABC transporter permease n=1 Tax=Micromonospora chalcea TaxID=1874 RepID=A0ABX9XUX3_MICCH|nr:MULTISPECIES: amino acid ABC transporter permease [Micromonospora]EWM68620.1 His/Glu/Gln/Arg/opine family amino acid ABC transporter permease [Micromonospora sp. M42]MBQ1068941.1 amino acid ABC transporter permease [Micromonospora sp. D75]MCK1808590.1 amino acid ABC transporter permease [Micromonospora sp. R42106]MCK1834864.1 amino acid ABC transporter permease [Micromonospora sp. R42003]MCK1846707.1 amino acid ABC transporter permease [Micromonospora sp. R42004]